MAAKPVQIRAASVDGRSEFINEKAGNPQEIDNIQVPPRALRFRFVNILPK